MGNAIDTANIVEGRPLDDAALVEQAKLGDVGAYEDLVRRYQDVAFRTAYLMTRSDAEAEDATQDAFLKAFRALAQFRSGSPFRPWLLRIVANEARNRVRATGRRERLALRAEQDHPPDDAAPSPEGVVLARERRQALLEAMNGLSGVDQLTIASRYFLELSEAEMADVLRCPRGTVKSRLSRALGRLRELLLAADAAARLGRPDTDHAPTGGPFDA